MKIEDYEALIERVQSKMCNEYCKIPYESVPEGKSSDWLWDDPDSPCEKCPLAELREVIG